MFVIFCQSGAIGCDFQFLDLIILDLLTILCNNSKITWLGNVRKHWQTRLSVGLPFIELGTEVLDERTRKY